MFKRYTPYIFLVIILVACSKDKLQTRPSIKLQDMNGTEFPLDPGTFEIPDLVINLEYDDKEGDLGGGILTYIRTRLNVDPIENPASNDKLDTIRSVLPDFPETSTGDMQLTIPGSFLVEDPRDNDTMTFSIFVQDVAGNISDTIVTPTIVQRKN